MYSPFQHSSPVAITVSQRQELYFCQKLILASKILRKFDTILQISPPHLSDVATLPWEIQKKSFSTVLFIHASDYLCYLRTKQSAIHLPTPPDSVTTLTCKLQNFFIWLKVSCVFSNVGCSEESQLWVVVGGCEKNRLWCVATGMSGKQCHSKCSECQPSALIGLHASSFSRITRIVGPLHAVLKFSPRLNKPLLQATTRSCCIYSVAQTQ